MAIYEETIAKMYTTIAATGAELMEKIMSSKHITSAEDIRFAKAVIRLYLDYPKHYIKMLKSKKHVDTYGKIVKWAYGKTSFLDTVGFNADLQTRFNWIFNGKDLTAECLGEGCRNVPGLGRSLRMNDRFPDYCSTKCSTSDGKTIEKARSTRYNRYGGKWESDSTRAMIRETVSNAIEADPDYYKKKTIKCEATKVRNGHDPKWNNRPKMKKTVEQHKAADPEYYEKIDQKSKATKVKNGHGPNWVNPELAKETNMARRGVTNPMKDPAVSAKSRNTFLVNHPDIASTFELPGVHQKCIARWMEKYGVDSPLKAVDVREKIIDTWINNYGVDNPWKVPEIIQKGRVTKLKIYGTLVSHRIYAIGEELFDSGWEAYMWLYCRDNEIDIVRNPCELKYEYMGRTHSYFPDFMINGELVEIKGDHFFRPDGKMFCPYRDSKWSDDEYEHVCNRYEAKRQCMILNNVRIVRHDGMNAIIKDVDSRLGNNCIEKYKV